MKLAIGTDHAGFEFKQGLADYLRQQGYDVLDKGTFDLQSVDYPDYAAKVCAAVNAGEATFGILVCGSGIGMSIAANKIHGIRAALCHDLYTARMGRSHNDANVIVLPSRMIALTIAEEMTLLFLKTPFEGGRHAARVDKMMKLEC
ncbi:MAG TPA: ribose 5-phosphate isomerase B [bacterium]|jgi:ribose 5-phosphate isomerase B|nr:ribose 5-phosphate isomerase B [bacterium]